MARIKTLEPAVSSIQGRVSRSDRVYFKRMHNRTFAVRLDNPYEGPWTETQTLNRAKFATVRLQASQLSVTDPETFAEYARKFKSQAKYATLNGYLMAKIWSGEITPTPPTP